MSETTNLKLFKPGTDDAVEVESSLSQNFETIDTKLGDSLKDRTGTVHTSLGSRLNAEQATADTLSVDVADLKKKTYNSNLNDPHFRTAAHRGLSFQAPENTLAAFQLAIDTGFWAIETDIQLTSDNKWVVIHDATIDRTSNGTGSVNGMTLAAIRAYDFGSWFDAFYSGERIPTFEEFLEICKHGQVVPYIEIKGDYTDLQMKSVVDVIRKYDMEYNSVIISFGLANLQKVRLYTKEIPLGYLTNEFNTTNLDAVVALGNAFLDVAKGQVTEANMNTARSKGVPVEAWTVDTNREVRSLLKLGVRRITTNRLMYARGY